MRKALLPLYLAVLMAVHVGWASTHADDYDAVIAGGVKA